MSIKGKANIVGVFEHPTRKADDKSLFQLHAECAAGALADAGLTKDDIDGYFCASGDTPGLGALSMIDYLGLESAPLGLDRHRRLVLPLAGRPRGRGDRGGQMLDRVDHLGRPAAHRRGGDRHRAARGGGAVGRDRVRKPLRAGDREHVRDVRDAAHAPVRHHQRAARLGQGRGLAPRAIQPACDAARRGHRRGRGQLADDRRPLAPARLLRDQRRRRRHHRRRPRGGEEPEAAVGPDHRRRRGAQAPDGRRDRPDLFGGGVVGAGGLCRSRGQARRHQIRLDLRQLYDHRRDADRGSGLLRERPGRPVRRPTAI